MNLKNYKINRGATVIYDEQISEKLHKTINGCHFIDSVWNPDEIRLEGLIYRRYEHLFTVEDIYFYGLPVYKDRLIETLIERGIIYIPEVKK